MITSPPFGRALCAMITPFTEDGERLDLDAAGALAARLIADGCDGLVLSGTTGESPTTSDAEKTALITAVRQAVGPDVPLIAGVGSADTRHTAGLARAAEDAGADGLLVVTPYYSRPPQTAVETHFRRVADAVGVPVMLYDIPGRTGTRIEVETVLRLAEHPRITAVKDCSGDLLGATRVIARTGLAYYSGNEELNLPLYAVGGAGYVSTVANVAPAALRAVLDAFDRGDTARAARLNARVMELAERMMHGGLPGTVTAKALLGAGPVREPLWSADAETTGELRELYTALLNGV
ncbi:4-hydroxy-tetrahydrodipicolinate synthase [Streptomyces clavuligerus]|nr:4-hydroxy-tetrahydrodipicolinate synthase [Streptomyces clavuligerus]ANW20774.1 4-hydroxy-tetrahydrodipicolinate synthase [Streptomyces clavuligerus]MBY6305494.1 4-hydroxy-tetrahydrodipicolinate synthase [Streptomyces clavuligerus]QPL65399.1 4-hydroxy-tetrahydrodipicolinate synthase [Streptomyces clavuligerus]QPL71430.1 4-hydroxy-tetrahydrodipicolinate synthase [Streptomyces clavuligerus]QPL77512.1 4-hydroxy-tetrahydrodipicolinate synthase [Streptomyces clavuligerus]